MAAPAMVGATPTIVELFPCILCVPERNTPGQRSCHDDACGEARRRAIFRTTNHRSSRGQPSGDDGRPERRGTSAAVATRTARNGRVE